MPSLANTKRRAMECVSVTTTAERGGRRRSGGAQRGWRKLHKVERWQGGGGVCGGVKRGERAGRVECEGVNSSLQVQQTERKTKQRRTARPQEDAIIGEKARPPRRIHRLCGRKGTLARKLPASTSKQLKQGEKKKQMPPQHTSAHTPIPSVPTLVRASAFPTPQNTLRQVSRLCPQVMVKIDSQVRRDWLLPPEACSSFYAPAQQRPSSSSQSCSRRATTHTHTHTPLPYPNRCAPFLLSSRDMLPRRHRW